MLVHCGFEILLFVFRAILFLSFLASPPTPSNSFMTAVELASNVFLLGKITPGLRKDVGGNLTFFFPKVVGVFLICLCPNFALLSDGFFFLFGPGSESNSNKQATSSGVKTLPFGIVSLSKICADSFSDKTFLFFFSAIRASISL